MKIRLSTEKAVKDLEFDQHVELFSDQDFIEQSPSGKSLGNNGIALGEGTSSFTDNSFAEGEYTAAGTRSFRVVSGDILASTWTLKTTEGIQPGYVYTVTLLNNYDMAGTVASVLIAPVISVDGFPVPRRA